MTEIFIFGLGNDFDCDWVLQRSHPTFKT